VATFGSGTFGSGTFGVPSIDDPDAPIVITRTVGIDETDAPLVLVRTIIVTPEPPYDGPTAELGDLALAVSLDGPAVVNTQSAAPAAGPAVPLALDAATAAFTTAAFPSDGIPIPLNGDPRSTTFGTVALPGGIALPVLSDTPTGETIGTAYYVDAVAGNDANPGTSPGSPWKTIAKVNASTFEPADRVLFKRATTWANANLVIDTPGDNTARIVFGAYGTGVNPLFDGGGNYTPISVEAAWTTVQDITCRNAGGEEKVGLGVAAADVLIQRVWVHSCALGIQVYAGGDRCRITASNVSDNDVLITGPGDNDDYGGQGITVLHADSVEIDHNTLDRNLCLSVDYFEDGAAVEVFGATNLSVHDNTAEGNQTFTELGDPATGDCLFYNNIVTGSHDYQIGFNVQGTGDYGPLSGTTYVYNNTVYLTGLDSVAVTWGADSPVVAHNNIFAASASATAGGPDVDEGHNVWTAALADPPIAASSVVAWPEFVSDTDLHLQATSPAINRGVSNYGHSLDHDGRARPGSGADAGAYEWAPALVTPDPLPVPVTLDPAATDGVQGIVPATPDSLSVAITPDPPTVTGAPPPIDYPIVPPPGRTAPALAVHLLGIGPWNTTVSWRGARNLGVAAGQRATTPVLELPMADTKSVTLRLGEGSEARTSHYFPRRQALLIEERITDLWWRRRDPHRGIVDRIGRFNASTVEVEAQSDGGVNISATYVDYQGLLEDRLILRYLNTEVEPPTIMWDKGTPIVEVLRWAVPTNMGLDLTGLQTGTADIPVTLKLPFHIPLGTPLADVFKNLLGVSTKEWEWWVEMPDSDQRQPRLTLAYQRGADRGVTLVDLGGQGPIARWSLQKTGDKYANSLYFIGHDGGVVKAYPDQIALYGQRDATDSNDTVLGTKDGSGVPYLLNAAADRKLAELAAGTPSYQVLLRDGFWEGRGHIDVGDFVTIHLEVGAEVIKHRLRVSELQIDIDGNGYEAVTLTLGTKRPAADPRSRSSTTARLVRYLKNYVVPPGA